MSRQKNPFHQFSCETPETLHSEVRITEIRPGIASCTVLHTSFRVILRSKHKPFVEGRVTMSANAVELAPSTADFKSLEEKILRTIELLKSAREAKAAAERDAARLREQLNEREDELETNRQELVTLRREREEVRARVEKMLSQIESLALEGE